MSSGLFSLPLAPAYELDDDAPRVVLGARERPRGEFIAGPENALVRALAAAVDRDEPPYNPLVLCGPAGVGKTCLAHALAARYLHKWPDASLIITTGSDLVRGLAHAIETDAVSDFRTRHQRASLLFIDDLHRLSGHAAAQQFLLGTLDALLRRGSLVIAAMPTLPHATDELMRPLASRLAAGLVVSLALPKALARHAIVCQEADRAELCLSDDLVQRLVGGDEDAPLASAPKLRHAVLELAAQSRQSHRPIEAAQITRLLAAEAPEARPVVRQVLLCVARQFGCTVRELKGKSRAQAIAEARGMAMYLARKLTKSSYAEIGRLLGNRDHSTVLHACKKIERQLSQCDATRRQAEELAAQISAALAGG